MEKDLNKYTKNELINIARNHGISGYSKLSKKELIDLLNSKIINKKKKKFNKDNIIKYTPIGIFILALLAFFGIDWNTINVKKSIKTPLFPESDTSLNILLLPLHPDQNCKLENTDYDNMILGHFQEMKDTLNLNLRVQYLKSIECPNSNIEARNIGNNENATIVIWGQYYEKCESPTKIRIRYTFAHNNKSLIKKNSGDSKEQNIRNVSDLRSGYLLHSLDDIIFRVLAINSLEQNDYEQSVKYLNYIKEKKICDVEIISLYSIALAKLNRMNEANQRQALGQKCINNELSKILEVENEPMTYDDFMRRKITFRKMEAYLHYARKNPIYDTNEELSLLNMSDSMLIEIKNITNNFARKNNWL